MKASKRFFLLLAKSALIALGLVALGTYIFFCPPILTANNGGFILFPLAPGEEYKYDTIDGVKREEIYFKNLQGSKLHAWYFQNQDKNAPVVLFSHGNAGNIGHRLLLAKCLLEAGASVFLFDYRQYGKSEGQKDLQGIIEDTRSAYDFLTKERKIKAKSIVLYGESIGGGPTCALAATAPVAGIILDSTFSSLLSVAKKKVAFFKLYPDILQPIPAFNNVATLKGEHAPLLIIHGQKDEIIPITEAEENYAAASQPKEFLILPGSTHNDKGADAALFVERLGKYFKSLKGAVNEQP